MAKSKSTKTIGNSVHATQEAENLILPSGNFPIVGIGASAGGLAAFEAFFSSMPADVNPGMAFVLVQHLAPDHKSILSDLIQRYTRMQVFEVEDGMLVQPNCAYIIPPNRDMAFLNGVLHLMEPVAPRGQRLPIDFFFRSLAQDQGERAICVVLSGTGSDGTLGVRAVKGEGGMVMVQNPESTEYDGMPRSAIATGLVDYELPPAEMPVQLMAYVAHAFNKHLRTTPTPPPKDESSLKKVFILLRAQTSHDFSQYKLSTIQRRIERRMALNQIKMIEEYVKLLQHTPHEVETLFRDLLIGVTNFFRDPEAFKALEEQIIPRLITDKNSDKTIRVWSPGCSTGEEAYSIAILLQERMETLRRSYNVQIFATDIDNQAIATARAGIYPASIAADIPADRLARYFSTESNGSAYSINKIIRDMLVFSEQNVIKDPPFSKIDLICCRNLLIYMSGELQKKLIPLFHYALNPGGFLFLGTSETVGEFVNLFTVLDRKLKLYQRKQDFFGAQRPEIGRFLPPLTGIGMDTVLPPATHSRKYSSGTQQFHDDLQELTEKALLQHATPAAALVNEQGNIFYFHGRMGTYLEPTPGVAGVNNILKMAREGLQRELTTALHKSAGTNEIIHSQGVRVKTNGDFTTIHLTVLPVAAGKIPLSSHASQENLFLVILEAASPFNHTTAPLSVADQSSSPMLSTDRDANAIIAALKRELRVKEDYLQTSNEELETSNEELRSSNEEMQSVNEELQSTNEELETSKEELQSINEELSTVNAELQAKVADLSRLNNDMNNLLAGTGIATVFVDLGMHILRFTPTATKLINLIQSDIGRPVSHIVSNLLGYDYLIADIQAVLDHLIPKVVDVQTTDGTWYRMRIQPYRTLENVIEGAVLTFMDITETRKANEALKLNEERMRFALNTSSITVFNQDLDLRYTWIYNPKLEFDADQVLGKSDADLLTEEEAAILTSIKKQVLQSGKRTRQDVRTTIHGKPYTYDLTIEPRYDNAGTIIGIIGAKSEFTDRTE